MKNRFQYIVNQLGALADQATPRSIFFMSLLYIVGIAVFIQLVLLPYIIPSWHAGDGLLVSSHDARRFHSMAVEMAKQIHEVGWQAWELRPETQAPAGIAAAIYSLTTPKPWTLIPLNAALHALGAMILWLIILDLWKNRFIATLSIMPFVIFPSAMQWYAQINKDGMTIAGSLMVLWGWLLLFRNETSLNSLSNSIKSSVLVFCGALIAWIPRAENAQIIVLGSIFVSVLLVIKYKNGTLCQILGKLLTISLCLLFLALLAQTGYAKRYRGNETISIPVPIEIPTLVETTRQQIQITWAPSTWLPVRIDRLFESISRARYNFIYSKPEAKSNIDTTVVFQTALDVIDYVPRATSIAFLAPFPNMWLGEGDYEANTIMRRIAAFEMIVIYLCLLGLLYYLWKGSGKIELWAAILFSYFYMLPIGLIVVNIGTLYRFRWSAIMTFVALGVACFIELLQKKYTQAR